MLHLYEVDQQIEDLGLYCRVERGGRFIGEDHRRLGGQGGRNGDTLFQAAGQLVRIGARTCGRVADADAAQQRHGFGSGPAPVEAAMGTHHLLDLVADGQYGVQATARILKDHTDAAAPHGRFVAFVKVQDGSVVQQHGPGGFC